MVLLVCRCVVGGWCEEDGTDGMALTLTGLSGLQHVMTAKMLLMVCAIFPIFNAWRIIQNMLV